LDQIGPIGKTVKDTAALFSIISGQDEKDATSKLTNFDFSRTFGGNLKGVRIGIPKEYFGEGVSAEVKTYVLEAAKTLENAGATLVSVSLPGTDYALSAYYIISCAEASSNLSRYDGVKYGYRAENVKSLEELFVRSRSEGFGNEVKRRIMLGTFVLSSGYYDAYYKKAKLFQQKLKEEFKKAFESCDMLLTPTAPDVAFKIGEIEDPIKMYASDICTVTVNLAGLPAVSVPVASKKDGMPVGMQLIGKPFCDNEILRVADIYENLIGGFKMQSNF
jgi:aspartyl-tRNA(Asn)/glutamyl-tRNA(Gln) amidotransferase subunit A